MLCVLGRALKGLPKRQLLKQDEEVQFTILDKKNFLRFDELGICDTRHFQPRSVTPKQ